VVSGGSGDGGQRLSGQDLPPPPIVQPPAEGLEGGLTDPEHRMLQVQSAPCIGLSLNSDHVL
jgi:hypothetical protein